MTEEKMIWRLKIYDEHNLKLLQMVTIVRAEINVLITCYYHLAISFCFN